MSYISIKLLEKSNHCTALRIDGGMRGDPEQAAAALQQRQVAWPEVGPVKAVRGGRVPVDCESEANRFPDRLHMGCERKKGISKSRPLVVQMEERLAIHRDGRQWVEQRSR